MAKQFFILIGDDHRSAKNALHMRIRDRFRKEFSETLIADPGETSKKMDEVIDSINQEHPRCQPVEGRFWRNDPDLPRKTMYWVPGLFIMTFYPVKEVGHG